MIKAKKSLGQNFLIDQNILKKIVDLVDIKDKNILEVGPGTGNLTEQILDEQPKKLIVVEKDANLANHLKKSFGSKIELINGDILELDENSLWKDCLTVFGNLPYNISTEILSRWILNLKNDKFWFDYLILMFQKEVADRIISISNSKHYGRLSVIANWKLDIKKICDISPNSFFPKPKIDSSLLLFKPKKDFYILNNSKSIEKITRIFFMHRRKMIKKPYNQIFNGNIGVANKLKITLNQRPQNLSIETYLRLAEEYEKLSS